MLLGKPYLGATEGNEHAHQEMKKFFRELCSHSSKSSCDCLQFMNLHKLKRIAVEEMVNEMPWTKYTEMLTGVAHGERRGKQVVKMKKDSDALLGDTNAALLELSTPQTQAAAAEAAESCCPKRDESTEESGGTAEIGPKSPDPRKRAADSSPAVSPD